jgi:hypothetical protein
MTDRDIVDRFNEITGFRGMIYTRTSRSPKHKIAYAWTLSRKKDCKNVLQMFLPYLGGRRKAKAMELDLIPQTLENIEET